MEEAFSTKTTAEWCEVLAAAGLRFAPVRDHAEVARDPGVRANGYITTVPDPDRPGADLALVRVPVTFSDPPADIAARVPELGQHTEEVLLEVGYSWEDIGALSAEGAI